MARREPLTVVSASSPAARGLSEMLLPTAPGRCRAPIRGMILGPSLGAARRWQAGPLATPGPAGNRAGEGRFEWNSAGRSCLGLWPGDLWFMLFHWKVPWPAAQTPGPSVGVTVAAAGLPA